MIRITAKRDGFRRCGVAHSTAGKEWPDAAWNKQQLARLEADPMLVVQRLAAAPASADATPSQPAPAPAAGTKAGKAAKAGKALSARAPETESEAAEDAAQ